MCKSLILVIIAALCCNMLLAQNVFNPADPIVTYDAAATQGSAANPSIPAPGVMTKWVKTTRAAWSTTNFKSYMWNGMAFRLRFPNNYNPANASKYPVLVFFHGGGETGTVYDNEDHLYWGAQLFEQRINNGDWNGFLLFPQQTSVGWDDNYFSRINGVLDTLQKYNNADPDRTVSMGLSSGGYGAVAYAGAYPKRVAVSLPSSPAAIRTLSGSIPAFVHVPVYISNGGLDPNPDPWNAQGFYADFRNAGGAIYQTYYVGSGHNTWQAMWNQTDASGAVIITNYWNSAHKAQPVVFYNNKQFCSTDPISAKMGITAGFFAYEWQKNGVTIGGATGNDYTATETGQYRVRFMRDAGGAWSAWSPNPIVVSTKSCAVDTLYAEHFTADNYFVSASAYSIGNFTCQGGIMTSGSEVFTQDATGVQGSRFLINYTKGGTGCALTAGDRVWNTYSPVTVLPNTNYEYSFYVGNQSATSLAQLAPAVNGVPLTGGFVQATGTGNTSWKKFSYTWNSGAFTYADLSIINRSIVTTGNDFAIDEISFKLAPAVPVPGCTNNTAPANGAVTAGNTSATLSWTATANAASYDVYLWTGTSLPASPIANVTTTSYSATGLTGSTQYNWYVVPKNSDAVAATGCSNNQTSFTTAATPVAPACVTGLSPANGAVLTTTTTAALSWNAAPTASSYDVYVWTGATAPTTPTANTTTTNYNVTGASPATAYNWYVVPKNAAGAASGCSANKTSFTTAAAVITGTGTGLKGDYYNSVSLGTSIALSRTDATVNFNWGAGSPAASIRIDNFSVRWTGFVQPLYSQTYTFYTSSDDGIRLWINGVQLINNWTDHGTTENSGSITLTAGVKYTIKMEYYERGGSAVAQLLWSSASTPKAIIPQKQLYLPSAGARIAADTTIVQALRTAAAVEVNRIQPSITLATGVYPNPVVKGQFANLQINSDKGGLVNLQVMNTTGNIVQLAQLVLAPGLNARKFSTANLAPGIYIIRLTGNAAKATTLKLVVR
jgi:pimeloyl-ACP methyl ester carboxylesterase